MRTEDRTFYGVLLFLALILPAVEVTAWLFGGWGR